MPKSSPGALKLKGAYAILVFVARRAVVDLVWLVNGVLFNTTQRHLINHEIDLIETSPHIINAKGCFFSVISFKINHSLTSKLIQTYLRPFFDHGF